MKKIFYLLIKIKIIFFLSIFQSKSDTFYYSGGCFWCTEQDFEEFRGLKRLLVVLLEEQLQILNIILINGETTEKQLR